MREIPIIFQPEMVKAILAGRKTQTRRIIKKDLAQHMIENCTGKIELFDDGVWGCKYCGAYHWDKSLKCPYGNIGDVLYVKETFYDFGYWKKNGWRKDGVTQRWKFKSTLNAFNGDGYRYLDNPPAKVQKISERFEGWYKRPGLFMPKKAARIFLMKENTRVERLKNISESDAISEGLQSTAVLNEAKDDYTGLYACEHFHELWEKINGQDSWRDNPWVWVNVFRIYRLKINGEWKELIKTNETVHPS